MTDVARRPRTTDFAFMRRLNDQAGSRRGSSSSGNSSIEQPTTVTDLQPYLGEDLSYPSQVLHDIASLANNFNDEMSSAQGLLNQGAGVLSDGTSGAEAGDQGAASTDFQFPSIPQALLEQAPEYEYSAHTRLNVFAEGLPDQYSGLTFDTCAGNTYQLPQQLAYASTWNLEYPGPAPAESAAATLSYLERGQSTPSSTSLLYSEPESVAAHDAASNAQDFVQMSGFSGTDTNQVMQPRGVFPSLSYNGYYNAFTKASSDGNLYYAAADCRSGPMSPAHHGQSASSSLNPFGHGNSTTLARDIVLRGSSSVTSANGEGSTPKRMRAGSSSAAAYAHFAPETVSPNARQIYSSPLHSSRAVQSNGHQKQTNGYDLSPSAPRLTNPSTASARTSLAASLDLRYDACIQQASSRDSDSKQSIRSNAFGTWYDQPKSQMSQMTGSVTAPSVSSTDAISSSASTPRNRRTLPASSEQTSAPTPYADDSRGTLPSGKGGGGRSTSPRQTHRKRKSVSGADGEDSSEGECDAPPPNPKAVLLAQAATTRQSGTQAQQDCLQALNEAMNQSLEQDGVARCPFPNCTKTFAKHRSYNLKTHLRSHSQLKPFACSSCPRAFSRKHDLERHARVHSGDRPYICEVCRRGFPRSDALRRHWRVEKECGDRSGDGDLNVSSAPDSIPYPSGLAGLAPMPFTDRTRTSIAGEGQDNKTTFLSRVHSDLRYPFGAGGSSQYPPSESASVGCIDLHQPITSSSGALLPNGKRSRTGW